MHAEAVDLRSILQALSEDPAATQVHLTGGGDPGPTGLMEGALPIFGEVFSPGNP